MERFFLTAGPWRDGHAGLAEAARQSGARFAATTSARDAHREIAKQRPGALVLDPNLTGAADLIQELRKSDALDLLPVIAGLPTATDAEAINVLTIGADDFVLSGEMGSQLGPKLSAAFLGSDPLPALPARRPVLLGDPSQLHRVVLGKLLAEAGFAVTTVADGEQAIAELNASGTVPSEGGTSPQREPFQLMILDLALPKMNALEVLTHAQMAVHVPVAIALCHVGIPDQLALKALTSGFRSVHDKRRPPEDLVFLANEAAAGANKVLRSSPRLLCSTMVSWRAPGGPLELGLTHNLSRRGLYVRTIDPPAMGTTLQLTFTPPGCDGALELPARIAWRKEFAARAVRSYPTGMGLAFDNMTRELEALFERACRTLASGQRPVTPKS
jgi:DNA-binding response OmpR family regulator